MIVISGLPFCSADKKTRPKLLTLSNNLVLGLAFSGSSQGVNWSLLNNHQNLTEVLSPTKILESTLWLWYDVRRSKRTGNRLSDTHTNSESSCYQQNSIKYRSLAECAMFCSNVTRRRRVRAEAFELLHIHITNVVDFGASVSHPIS